MLLYLGLTSLFLFIYTPIDLTTIVLSSSILVEGRSGPTNFSGKHGTTMWVMRGNFAD